MYAASFHYSSRTVRKCVNSSTTMSTLLPPGSCWRYDRWGSETPLLYSPFLCDYTRKHINATSVSIASEGAADGSRTLLAVMPTLPTLWTAPSLAHHMAKCKNTVSTLHVLAIWMWFHRKPIDASSILQVPERATDEEVGCEWWYCPFTCSLTAHLYVITVGAHCFHLHTSSTGEGDRWGSGTWVSVLP